MKKTFKLTLAVLLVIAMAMIAGCSKTETSQDVSSAADESAASSEASIGDESEIKETNDEAGAKPVILTVSFGTSYNDSREKTIGAIEESIAAAYPDYEVRRAFTSQIIIDKLKERDNIEIDNVEEAFERLVSDGVKTLVVQPTHLMRGYEYNDLIDVVEDYRDNFDKLAIGEPLLTSDKDYSDLSQAVVDATSEYNNDSTAVVFMGHGTEHEANEAYAKFQESLTATGNNNYFIGTVEATPSLEDMVNIVKDGGYTKVVLEPLMVVAGDHANNDMAGDDDDSWKSVFESEGFEVECILKGLGEIEDVRNIYVAHVNDAINSFGE